MIALLALAGLASAVPQDPSALAHMRITGIVVGVDGTPVPNCELWCGDGIPGPEVAHSDGSGGFVLVTERRQFVTLHARAAGIGIGACWVGGLEEVAPFVRVDLLPCRRLHGTVRDASGAPLPGAVVAAAPSDLDYLALACAQVVAGPDGEYVLPEVVLGPIRVRATLPGVGAALVTDATNAPTIDLEIDRDECRTLTIEFTDDDAARRARAEVRLCAEQDGCVVPLPAALAVGRCDGEGRCVFVGLPFSARIHFEVCVPGAAAAPAFDFMPQMAREWSCVAHIGPAPPPIAGHVVHADGSPAAALRVLATAARIDWQQQRPAIAVTDADGAFRLPSPVAAGEAVAFAVLADAETVPAPPQEEPGASVAPFEVVHDPAQPPRIVLRPTLRVRGRLVAADGGPIVGARVDCAMRAIAGGLTGPDGRFGLVHRTGLAIGTTTLVVGEVAGGLDLQLEGVRYAVAAPNAGLGAEPQPSVIDVDLGTLRLSGHSVIHGVALDEQGQPVPGARVWLVDEYARRYRLAIAGRKGEYSFAGLTAGNWLLGAAAEGFRDPDMILTLENDDRIRRDCLVQ